ncbi:MAG: class I SAM-dependent methyltransferase [Candidatus Symbiopectobacterium sp. Dall1.0]|nr:class I SAM-dependent methyltransferase [Candidatus Symbiopectobacterium sp. Dall1.0]
MKLAHTPQAYSSPMCWEDIPWGAHYQKALEHALAAWWPRVFGFHLLKVGALSNAIATDTCAISHQVNINPSVADDVHVLADPYQLPFSEKSIDACLLAHTLSYSSDPHRILREVDRVLINDGWLLLSGFNPISLLGAGKLTPGLRQCQPYCARMFTQMRMIDWLSLLNYEVLYQGTFHVVPWKMPQMITTSAPHSTPLGCLMLLVARKRTIPLTMSPLRQRFNKLPVRRAVGATKSYRKGFRSS